MSVVSEISNTRLNAIGAILGSILGPVASLLEDGSTGCAIWDDQCKNNVRYQQDQQAQLQAAALQQQQSELDFKKKITPIALGIGGFLFLVVFILILRKK